MRKNNVGLGVVGVLVLVMALVMSASPGCVSKTTPLAPGGPYTDGRVYNFDLSTNTMHELLQTFLDWEKTNNVRARLPVVGVLADDIRATAPAKFKKAEDAKVLYESLPRTPEGATDLQRAAVALDAAIVVLQAIVRDANAHMIRAAVEGI